MKTWMRRRGGRVRITTGKHAGRTGTVDSNVHQRTATDPAMTPSGPKTTGGFKDATRAAQTRLAMDHRRSGVIAMVHRAVVGTRLISDGGQNLDTLIDPYHELLALL